MCSSDLSTPARRRASRRAYAFTHSSQRLLRRLGLWEEVAPVVHPFAELDLADVGCRQGLRFDARDLRDAGPGADAVGWIGEHGPLMDVLLARVEAHPAIHAHLGSGLDAGEAAGADLIVAADGPLSPTREALGIGVWRHAYGQHCLTAQITLRGAPQIGRAHV